MLAPIASRTRSNCSSVGRGAYCIACYQLTKIPGQAVYRTSKARIDRRDGTAWHPILFRAIGVIWGGLDENDFEARYELQRKRDELRDRVRTSVDRDDGRSTDDLLEELRARRNALAQIQESMVSSAGMSGGDGAGSHEDGVKLNSEILAGSRAQHLAQRIARLETILSELEAL